MGAGLAHPSNQRAFFQIMQDWKGAPAPLPSHSAFPFWIPFFRARHFPQNVESFLCLTPESTTLRCR